LAVSSTYPICDAPDVAIDGGPKNSISALLMAVTDEVTDPAYEHYRRGSGDPAEQ
jgi:hypothetical protein